MIRVLVIGAVLIAVAGVAGWALAGFAGHIHERAEQERIRRESDVWEAGKGNASQASGSPGQNGGRRG